MRILWIPEKDTTVLLPVISPYPVDLTESLNPKHSMVSLELPSVRMTQELQNRSTRSSSVASLAKQVSHLNPFGFIYTSQTDTSCFGMLKACLGFKTPNGDRTVFLGRDAQAQKYVKNIVKNQKYSVLTLVPVVLYHQFKYFFNLFYLLIALSQFVPALKVGNESHTSNPFTFVS